MDERLIRERYKVVRVLCSEAEYTAVEAVDIQERERPDCLINLYEGETLRRCSRVFAALRREDCPAFRRLFLDGQNKTLAVVFEAARGLPFDVFFAGAKLDREERLKWVERILHAALTLNNLPWELACAALRPENLLLRERDGTVELRFVVMPPPETPESPPIAAACRVLEMYPRHRCATFAEEELLDLLGTGDFSSLAELYACWRRMRERMEEESAELKKRSWIRRLLVRARLLLRALIWKMR